MILVNYKKLSRAILCSSMTQREIARKAGIDETTISRFMHGKVRPIPPTVSAIAGAIGMSMDDFLVIQNE